MANKAIAVTIGRNVGSEPLPREEWNHYVRQVRLAVEEFAAETWVASPGRGHWEGVAEDNFTWIAGLDDDDPDDTVVGLKARLANLATYYGQDSIAVLYGVSDLVSSYGTGTTVPALVESAG